jgi:cobalamin-dependent methionine synthase I
MDRRRRDLVGAFMAALGGPSAVNELHAGYLVRKAAELVVLAEATRAGMLNGVVTDITALIRIEREARSACRALGLKTEPDKPAPGLERARQRMNAQARSENTKAAKADRREKPPQRVRPPDDDEAQAD